MFSNMNLITMLRVLASRLKMPVVTFNHARHANSA
jgi:hypothetical protein